jgi:hypothetical protein
LKDFFKKIQPILIIILIVLLLLQGWYYRNSTPVEPTIITKIETKWDTITIQSLEYVPKLVDRVITKYETVYKVDSIPVNVEVDTAGILKEYFAKNVYVDKIVLDTFGSVTLIDTISQNKIYSRKYTSDILPPPNTITNNIYINDKGFYAGGSLGINQKMLHSISGEILYKTKNSTIFGVGLGLGVDNNLLSPVISGKAYWKIGKK